jgi:hypothetical protein
MYTLINCGSLECAADAQDKISVMIKDGDDGAFTEVFNISMRSIDDRWYNQIFNFMVRKNKVWVNLFIRIKIKLEITFIML